MDDYKFLVKPTDVVFPHMANSGMSRFLMPARFQITHDNEGGAGIADQGGYIMNRDEFERLLPMLMNFYERNSDEQIAEMNAEHGERWQRESKGVQIAKPGQQTALPGFIYVIRCDGYYKIGRTKHPSKRIGKFSTAYPHDLTVIRTARVRDMIGIEAELHKLFDGKRVRGEWFNLGAGDIQQIAEMLPDVVEVQL